MVLRAGFHGTVGQPSAQVIDGSLKFDDGNKNYLERTPGSAGNRQTFTWSGWIKRSSIGSYQVLFGSYSGSDDFHHVRFRNDETLETRLEALEAN